MEAIFSEHETILPSVLTATSSARTRARLRWNQTRNPPDGDLNLDSFLN